MFYSYVGGTYYMEVYSKYSHKCIISNHISPSEKKLRQLKIQIMYIFVEIIIWMFKNGIKTLFHNVIKTLKGVYKITFLKRFFKTLSQHLQNVFITL